MKQPTSLTQGDQVSQGGVDYGGAIQKLKESAGDNSASFSVLEPTRGRLMAWLFGQEYRFTDDALDFLQPKFDEVLGPTGQHLDLSEIRFSLDPNLGAPGQWVGGMDVKLQDVPDSLSLQFKFATHEAFHIAQGLVAGNGDLAAGYAFVKANYWNTNLFTRPLDGVHWNQVSPSDLPAELGAQAFTDSLFDSYWGHR